ncbi:MAG: biotin/lipoyl-containing protein, partial [Gemmatimonadaceae bacterium]
MATKVVMEALSPTMEEGRLVKWSKNEGDQIKSGDVLAEVETDKAVMELVARGDGVLRKRLANEGDASPVGTLLAVIAGPDENIDSIVGSAAPAAAAAPAAKADAGAQATTPNAAVAETKEAAGATAVPQTPAQSQGEASTPPQQKASSAPAAPPPRPAAPRPPSPPAARSGNGSSRPASPAAGGRQRSSPLAR